VPPRSGPLEQLREIYDIFEGTEQIQQLVIARAISGMRIQ
jgi:alkylation response protein AidB-like acyl-CoA dehydrogenase